MRTEGEIKNMNNPYPEKLIDEASGVEVPDERHQIWEDARQATLKEIAQDLRATLKKANDLSELGSLLVSYVLERLLEGVDIGGEGER